MSNIEQMNDNTSYMENFVPLTDQEYKVVAKARDVLASLPIVPCTSCDYCAKVCHQDIGISGSFAAYNMLTLYKNMDIAKHQENWRVEYHNRKQAKDCIQCCSCVEVCPQHINIPIELKKVAKALGQTS